MRYELKCELCKLTKSVTELCHAKLQELNVTKFYCSNYEYEGQESVVKENVKDLYHTYLQNRCDVCGKILTI